MIHWSVQWWKRAIALLYSIGGSAMADEQTDDQGTLDVGMIVGLAMLGAKFIPGEGGEQHLKNCLWELSKFLDARVDALDKFLDIDG